ncbi:tyrosine-type recombinase/integrase [Pararobbsia silviterrae]|uniref:Site-specific integrase n=1 Tax=Pararobbsia silviterrae TaxID=1792498 RepID=A0A494X877_9BURK|nr:site-specific integrase [Pararobbsia silviterrae]RKP46660.1 site-specific integrase [Pararobbsia silviterrae]
MRFDARAAKLLQPQTHMTIDGSPGLRLEASATRKSWIYRYKSPISGLMKQTKIGAWPNMSVAAAITEWEKLRELRDAGIEPGGDKRKTSADMVPQTSRYTVEQVCRAYLVGHVEVSRKSKGAAEIARMFRTMLDDVKDLDASSVTRSQAFDLLESHRSRPVQAQKLRAELGAAWDYALDAGRLPDTTPNWWRQILRGKLRSTGKTIAGERVGSVKRVLSDAEVGELIRWLPNFSDLLSDALTLYFWTGTRGGEIVAMEGAEIADEPDGLWWTIPKAKTKNARRDRATDLRVPLIGRAEAIVRKRKSHFGDRYLFPVGFDGHSPQNTIQTQVYYHQPYSNTRPKMRRPRLTVSHWTPHDIRRTVRTMLAAMDCRDDVAEAVLGHVQPGVKGVYNRHSYDKQRREWLTKLSAHLETLASTGAAS